ELPFLPLATTTFIFSSHHFFLPIISIIRTPSFPSFVLHHSHHSYSIIPIIVQPHHFHHLYFIILTPHIFHTPIFVPPYRSFAVTTIFYSLSQVINILKYFGSKEFI